jgi:hypothetical protein
MSTKHVYAAILTLGLAVSSQIALSGPLDPDCTAEKAAKSAIAKSTVGVGGRCSPGEAAKDTAKDAAGIEDKGVVEKAKDGDKNPLKSGDN